MPLSEFLRMAGKKIESTQQRPCPADLSLRSENDLLELIWDNGQIMMQGQSSRVTRSPALNTNRAGNARNGKFGGVESVLNDMSPVVPSGDLDLSQVDDVAPWLDDLAQDYSSVLLPEISGVTCNGTPAQNNILSSVSNLHSSGSFPKTPSSLKDHLLGSWPPPQHRQTSEALGSAVSDFINNNTSNHSRTDVVFANPPTNNGLNYVNFSHFARPANLMKGKFPNSNEIPTSGVERVDVMEKLSNASGINPVADSGQPVDKVTKDSCPPGKTESFGQETLVKNGKPLLVSNGTDSDKRVLYGEKIVEPMVASSSVGSGNSADRVSCEQTLNSKRKFHDTEESECRSDDVGLEKPTPARGSGSKRSRAAEVHNLSERKRRDRINEKMRALQELIPNCNKADKASMLDEAIEYLKTLQLQVQIMSMGAGLYMPTMMFPPGMQQMHPAHILHVSTMRPVGMGMGMGYGMGMLDMNCGSPVFPVSPLQAPHFSASVPAHFHRMAAPNPLVYGHSGQGLPNSVPRPPLFPLSGQPAVNSDMGLNGVRNGSQNEVPSTPPVLNSGDTLVNCNAIGGSTINQKSDKLHATNEVLNQSATVPEDKQPTDAGHPATFTSTTTTDPSKEPCLS